MYVVYLNYTHYFENNNQKIFNNNSIMNCRVIKNSKKLKNKVE